VPEPSVLVTVPSVLYARPPSLSLQLNDAEPPDGGGVYVLFWHLPLSPQNMPGQQVIQLSQVPPTCCWHAVFGVAVADKFLQ